MQEYQCNDFLAGNVLRSANRYMALDETAVFGCCCRHEFPGIFVNLKHGERYRFCYVYKSFVSAVHVIHLILCRVAYAVWMLEKMVQKYSGSELFVMYDIACTLFKHLRVNDYHLN